MCRSTMRALAQAQAQAQAQAGASSENSSSNTLSARNTSDVPSFARNTVASTTRTKKELCPPSIPPTPGTPYVLGRHTSVKQTRFSPTVPAGEERPQGTNLRRAQSVKVSRSSLVSETPSLPYTREDVRKTNSAEKGVQSRDSSTPSRSAKPSWK